MRGFQPEVQALRALAVGLVVLFHLWPERVPGGYVGVDVFFAISGFLITGHLLREFTQQGRIDFPAFWARRIRRLLPAAALVLAVCLVATLAFLPSRFWQETALQIGASAIGVQNWALAANAVDYFGVNALPSLVQHYWSLSLEEQFYVIWPVLLGGVLLLARRIGGIAGRLSVAAAMITVFIASLTWSIIATEISQQAAYFSTLTHAWEFALGGLLAVVHRRLMAGWWGRRERTRAIATWLGLAAIVASAFLFSGKSAFPGWIALLPIMGTLLVIAAGMSTSRIQRPLLLNSPPVQLVGSASYSIYLWHWPPIVVVPAILGHELGLVEKIVILIGSVVAGWLTKIFVEDPARQSRALGRRTAITYALAAAAAGALVMSSTGLSQAGAARAAEARAVANAVIEDATNTADGCFGAQSMLPTSTCPDRHVLDPTFGPDFAADDWGSLAGVNKDGSMPDTSACVDFSGMGLLFLDCFVGEGFTDTTLAIVGDSHALALTEPLVRIAESQGWGVRVLLRNSCTPSLPVLYRDAATKAECNQWRDELARRIADDPNIDIVVATGYTRGEPGEEFAGTRSELVESYAGLWSAWIERGKRVFVIEDVPLNTGDSVPECVASHLGEPDPCTVTRSEGLAWDPAVDAAAASGAELISLTDLFCDAQTCHSVIGGLIAYRDAHHLAATFAMTLTPRLSSSLLG